MTTRSYHSDLPSVLSEERKLIAVSGATGSQGGSVVKAFQNSDQYKIRALTRNPESAKAKTLTKYKNVELFKCESGDIEQLRLAFKDVYGVFANTSYWGNWGKDYSAKDEVQQGHNMIDAAIECDLVHVIWVSQPNVNALSYNKLHSSAATNKNMVERYARTKYALSKTIFTYIYPGFALSNIENFFKFRIVDNVVQNDPLPILPETKLAYVDIDEDLGKIVRYIFENPKLFKNEDFMASSGNITIPELLELVAKEAGLTWKFNQVSYEEYGKIVKNQEMVDLFRFWNEYGHLYQDVGVGRKLIPELKTAEQWVKSRGVDWLFKNSKQ